MDEQQFQRLFAQLMREPAWRRSQMVCQLVLAADNPLPPAAVEGVYEYLTRPASPTLKRSDS